MSFLTTNAEYVWHNIQTVLTLVFVDRYGLSLFSHFQVTGIFGDFKYGISGAASLVAECFYTHYSAFRVGRGSSV
jgi:hypothetical protein